VLGFAHFGMSLFFVLSGFVIHYNYANSIRKQGLIRGGYYFMAARFARLYPLYGFCMLLSIGHFPSENFMGQTWIAISALTLTQTWFNVPGVSGSLFGQSWSISTEWFFYVAFIALVWPLAQIKKPLRALNIFLIAATIFLCIIFKFKDPIVAALTPIVYRGLPVNNPPWLWLTYFAPYLRILEFIAGVLASQVYLSLKDKPQHNHVASLYLYACLSWCGAAIILTAYVKNGYFENFLPNFIYAPALAPALVLLCRYETALSRLVSKPALLLLGEISYSVYVFQFAILNMAGTPHFSGDSLTVALLNSIIKAFLMLLTVTAIGYGSYFLIEIPTRRWLRAKLFTNAPTVPDKLTPAVNVIA